jgi:hypothetical protein
MLVLTTVYQLSRNKKWRTKKRVSFFDAISDHPSEPVPEPDPDSDPSPDPNPGVGGSEGDDSSPNSGVNDDKPTSLDNSFNPDGYWGINAHLMLN